MRGTMLLEFKVNSEQVFEEDEIVIVLGIGFAWRSPLIGKRACPHPSNGLAGLGTIPLYNRLHQRSAQLRQVLIF